MPTVDVDQETLERLDQIRLDDESYDEVITELINIYEAEELTLHSSGD
jgi:predicted CopG family antitoxin